MKTKDFKAALNSELKREGLATILRVDQINTTTVLVFKNRDQATIKWLNKRFLYGVSVIETDHSLVFINTPNPTTHAIQTGQL